MTEEKINNAMENVGDVIESVVEATAQRMDDSLERTMKHRSARIITTTISNVTGLGLIVTSMNLKEKEPTLAKICLITGGLTLVTNIFVSCFIRKR